MTTPVLVLEAPPPALLPALRRLAVASFDLEQALTGDGLTAIDEEVCAFGDAQRRVRELWAQWAASGREELRDAGAV